MKNLERVARTGGPNSRTVFLGGWNKSRKNRMLSQATRLVKIFERVNVNGITGYVIIQKAYGTWMQKTRLLLGCHSERIHCLFLSPLKRQSFF